MPLGMGMPTAQEGGVFAYILNMLFLFVFFFLMFKLQMYQIVAKLEKAAEDFEALAGTAKRAVVKQCVKGGGKRKKVTRFVNNFADFFVIPPLDADPYGIIHKVEHLLNTSESRFKEGASRIMPQGKTEELADISMSLKGVVGLNQIAKIVRNAVELAKTMKNFQIALIIQMQLPMLEKLAKGELEGTKAFLRRFPIGDAIGPYVIASMADDPGKELAEEMMVSRGRLQGRDIFFVKAKGPGARVGKPGDAVELLLKQNKISRVITIDAAAKLEGEKTGSVAEGVGVAMGGGVNPERVKIEETALKYNVPIDAIAIKMGMEEAIKPLNGKILKGMPEVKASIEDSLDRTPKGSNVIIIGVGNTVGIGNCKADIKDIPARVKQHDAKLKREKLKKRTFLQKLFPQKEEEEEGGQAEIPVTQPGDMGVGMYLLQNKLASL